MAVVGILLLGQLLINSDLKREDLAQIPKGYDLVVSDLESLCCVRRRENIKLSHVTTYEALDLLTEAGINVISLANNHAFDTGVEGYVSTHRHLTEAGVIVLGDNPKLVEIETKKIVLVGLATHKEAEHMSLEKEAKYIDLLRSEKALENWGQMVTTWVAQDYSVVIVHHYHKVGDETIDRVCCPESCGPFFGSLGTETAPVIYLSHGKPFDREEVEGHHYGKIGGYVANMGNAVFQTANPERYTAEACKGFQIGLLLTDHGLEVTRNVKV